VGEKSYLLFKTMHVVGSMLFVGNLLVTFVWKLMADRTRNPRVIKFAQRLVTLTDSIFTGSGALLLLFSGLMMVGPYGIEFWNVPWLMWGLTLFAVSGLIWLLILVPIQIKQARMARGFAGEDEGQIPDSYWLLSRLWMGFGGLATLLPLINVYLMVAKPL